MGHVDLPSEQPMIFDAICYNCSSEWTAWFLDGLMIEEFDFECPFCLVTGQVFLTGSNHEEGGAT